MVAVLSIIIGVLIVYIVCFQIQIRNINRQLAKRLKEQTRQPISLELFNKDLNSLANYINQCLKAEETLRLEVLQEEKRFKELIANISHDLRTPLTVIKGYQQMLEKGPLNEEQHKKLHIAQRHADDLGDLIEHFFEYSYLTNMDPSLSLQRINLTNLVTENLAEFVTSFEEMNRIIHYVEKQPVIILADREIMVRIIQNLIRNALIHSEGDIKVEIKSEDYGIMLFKNPVRNPKEIEIERLFERFYTGDKARRKSTGLGLSIVKLLAEQMNGFVTAEMIDKELEIRVKLPLYQKEK